MARAQCFVCFAVRLGYKSLVCGATLQERGNVILARAQCISCFAARLNEMQLHQLYDSYESYELTRA